MMDLSIKVLGGAAVSYLHGKQTLPVLKIGKDSFTRADLAHVSCFTFSAAANLSKILTRAFKVYDTEDVFERIHPEELALPRLGAVSLAVLGAAFEAKGLGGKAPLEAWVKKHRPDAKLVTFNTLKHRDEQERAAERKAQRQRKATRRNKAHRTRVERFITRGESHA